MMRTLLVNARLLDGSGTPPVPDAWVLVVGDRIAEVGAGTAPPPDADAQPASSSKPATRSIGVGQTFEATKGVAEAVGLESVTFLPRTDYESLADLIASASISLGIFGTTPKSFRVVPNKVYDALAAGKAVVTGGHPGRP